MRIVTFVRLPLSVFLGLGLTVLGCSSSGGDDESSTGDQSALGSAPSREEVLEDIRDGALAHGITKGWLIAGIAKVETQYFHCRPEHLYCAGPASADCGGAPVLAGGSDGTCAQGGIGLFQLDNGTQTQTVNDYKDKGIDILSVKGNVEGGIESLLEKLQLDTCVKGISSDAAAVSWLNDVALGGTDYATYTGMLAHCYNGWPSGGSGWRKEKAKYDAGIRDALSLHDAAWWAGN